MSTRYSCLGALILSVALAGAATPACAAGSSATAADPRIAAMKTHPRGPFSRILWFCKDGQRLPPTPSACVPYGGGAQHGEWSETTLALRADGYRIANVYADLDIDQLLAEQDAAGALGQMAIERFLLRIDDGWILRRARSYRGALQEEGERAGAQRLLRTLAASTRWSGPHYLTWRTLAALLPHGADTASARAVRQDSSNLLQRDAGFLAIKNKIHVAPDAGDAATVRAYAARHDDPALTGAFEKLAADIDALYAVDTGTVLTDLATRLADSDAELAAALVTARSELAPDQPPPARFAASARLLAALRTALPRLGDASLRLRALDAGLLVEAEHFVAASAVVDQLGPLDRAGRIALLRASADALYGTGLLSARQHTALEATFAELTAASVDLAAYRAHMDYLGLVPGWGDRHMQFAFGAAQEKLAAIEPLALLFIQDQLRGSPLFFYAAIVDDLQRDANRLAGVAHRLFDEDTGGGLRALNPGLARGVLRDGRGLALDEFSADGIYLLPETIAELPPVAGILTAGEGNPLSHVQLLARNLGIPNVAVASSLLEELGRHQGERVVLAVSAGGGVHLRADGPDFDAVFGQDAGSQHLIEPELDKLDLARRELVDLADLRAGDSGRTVGPKAAKLGELKASYPDAVADGVAVPFGVFRALLDGPAPDDSGPMFDYIVNGYRALEALPGGAARERATDTFRQSIHDWVAASRLPDALVADLRQRLETRLGADGTYGVFVRSDTNVEDLPGFTGAGLNLTVANVVGFANIMAAIPQVWASPFTARAFSWRQALMRQPEHVYPAVLLLESVDAAKSGVLVTQDIDTGDRGWISVAVNEGVGGAVDGQSAESLRIHLDSGRVRLMAQASAPIRRQVDARGGVAKLPASGADTVLETQEIAKLIAFVRELPTRFPAIVDATGAPAPADVEFGFVDGELHLFQLRPFLDNSAARGNQYLIDMDPTAAALAGRRVDLTSRPE